MKNTLNKQVIEDVSNSIQNSKFNNKIAFAILKFKCVDNYNINATILARFLYHEETNHIKVELEGFSKSHGRYSITFAKIKINGKKLSSVNKIVLDVQVSNEQHLEMCKIAKNTSIYDREKILLQVFKDNGFNLFGELKNIIHTGVCRVKEYKFLLDKGFY